MMNRLRSIVVSVERRRFYLLKEDLEKILKRIKKIKKGGVLIVKKN